MAAEAVRSLFMHGFAVEESSQGASVALRQLLMREKWKEDLCSHVFMPDWVPEVVLDGSQADREATAAAAMAASLPIHYKRLIEALVAQSPIAAALGSVGKLSVSHASVWNGVEHLGWHWDGYDEGDFILITYLTDEECWPDDLGGSIHVGIDMQESLDLDFRPDRDVRELAVVFPEHGRSIWLNNLNPFFVHRTTPLKRQVNRFTVSTSLRFHKKN